MKQYDFTATGVFANKENELNAAGFCGQNMYFSHGLFPRPRLRQAFNHRAAFASKKAQQFSLFSGTRAVGGFGFSARHAGETNAK